MQASRREEISLAILSDAYYHTQTENMLNVHAEGIAGCMESEGAYFDPHACMWLVVFPKQVLRSGLKSNPALGREMLWPWRMPGGRVRQGRLSLPNPTENRGFLI